MNVSSCRASADSALTVSLFAVIDESTSTDILVYLLVFITTVLAISLVFLFMMLCEFEEPSYMRQLEETFENLETFLENSLSSETSFKLFPFLPFEIKLSRIKRPKLNQSQQCKISLPDNRFQRRRQAAMRSKMLHEQDVQLSRLRATTDDSALTNFNPSYGCEGILNGGSVDVKSLPQVARDSLRLIKYVSRYTILGT